MNRPTSTTIVVLWLCSNNVVHVFILTSFIPSTIGNCLRGLDITWRLLKWRYHHKVLPKPSSIPIVNCCLWYSIQTLWFGLRWTCYVKLVLLFRRTFDALVMFRTARNYKFVRTTSREMLPSIPFPGILFLWVLLQMQHVAFQFSRMYLLIYSIPFWVFLFDTSLLLFMTLLTTFYCKGV